MLPYRASREVGALCQTQMPGTASLSACPRFPSEYRAICAPLTTFIATVSRRAGASIALPVMTTRSRIFGAGSCEAVTPGVCDGARTTLSPPAEVGNTEVSRNSTASALPNGTESNAAQTRLSRGRVSVVYERRTLDSLDRRSSASRNEMSRTCSETRRSSGGVQTVSDAISAVAVAHAWDVAIRGTIEIDAAARTQKARPRCVSECLLSARGRLRSPIEDRDIA